MTHHAHSCGSDNLVELKSEECLEPSPKQKIRFAEDHPGNEDWAQLDPTIGRSDGSVGNDHANQCSEDARMIWTDQVQISVYGSVSDGDIVPTCPEQYESCFGLLVLSRVPM